MEYGICVCYVLLFVVLVKQLKYYKNMRIRPKHSVFEWTGVVLGELIFIGAAILFGKHLYDYFIALLAIIVFFVDWFKQGLNEKGLVTIIKGKSQYQWAEIKEAVIAKNGVTKIVYYNQVGTPIITQKYSNHDLDEIVKLFHQHSLSYQIYNIDSIPFNSCRCK